MLTATGAATTAIASMVSAELLSFHYDIYASEAGWSISDASGVVASGAAGSTSTGLSYSSGFYYWSGSDSDAGYMHLVSLDLAAGDYSITLTDSYGDGWNDTQWNDAPNTDGTGAFSGGGLVLDFTSGSSVSGTFTVAAIPAPGALALLGLAGLVGSRRRK